MRRALVAIAGGVGAARFLDGLARINDPARLFIIGNTGDDAVIHGLHISPDLDTVTYTLAGLADPDRGWGLEGDSFHCLGALGRLGADTWFQLGDRDLGTHLYRTERLRAGARLSEVTSEIARALGVRAAIVPMSDEPVRTRIHTRRGELEFQEWFVRRRTRDAVLDVSFEGAAQAQPAPGVLDAIQGAEAVIICPSNPIISIGPVLASPLIHQALCETRAPAAAISPIVGGRALKGPAARMMRSMWGKASALCVAERYREFLDVFVLDEADRGLAPRVESLGLRAVVANTIMKGIPERTELARTVLRALGVRP